MSERRGWGNGLFDECIKTCTTPEEMRAELFRMSYHDSIIRNCRNAADYGGLSAEDRYTLMAYQLLDAYYRIGRIMLQQEMLSSSPPIIFSKDVQP